MSVSETLRLDGRTALVTGASRGIGRQAALTLAAAGASWCWPPARPRTWPRWPPPARPALPTPWSRSPTSWTRRRWRRPPAPPSRTRGPARRGVQRGRRPGLHRLCRRHQDRGLGQGARPQPALGVRWPPGRHGLHLPQGGSIVNVASIAGSTASPGWPPTGRPRRGDLAHPHPGRRGGPPRGAGLRLSPRLGPDRAHLPHVVGPGDQPGPGRPDPDGPLGRRRGAGRAAAAARLRRRQLHHRHHPGGRRRALA